MPSSSFAQTWMWANRLPGSEGTQQQRISTDADGNVIVSGGSYIAKYNSSGLQLWKKDPSNGFDAQAMNLCTDAAGNILVTGTYTTTTTFGTTTLSNSGYEDVFVAKYDAGGNVLWARNAGGVNFDIAYTVATDAVGNVIVGGSFASPGITFGSTTLTGTGTNMFLVKYSGTGDVIWARIVNNDGSIGTYTRAAAIAIDNFGNIIVGGEFSGYSVNIGSNTLTNTSYPFGDLFVAKYDDGGTAIWAERMGSDYYDAIWDIAVDGDGNSYVVGNFTGDSMQVNTEKLYNIASSEMEGYVTSYDGVGELRWARLVGGVGTEEVLAAETDNTGNLYVAFNYDSPTMLFGTTTFTNGGATGTSEAVVGKYSSSGTELWAIQIGKLKNDVITGMALDGLDNVYISGTYSDSIGFGTTTLTTPGVGFVDIFIAKMGAVPTTSQLYYHAPTINIYPNPANGILIIDADRPITEIAIINTCGQQMLRKQGTEHLMEVDVNALSPGAYSLIINNDEVRRFVKE